MSRTLDEIVTVRLGIVGMTDHGLGTAPVRLDLDQDDTVIGSTLAAAYRRAHTAAVADLGPKLTRRWVEQAPRLIEGDPEPEV